MGEGAKRRKPSNGGSDRGDSSKEVLPFDGLGESQDGKCALVLGLKALPTHCSRLTTGFQVMAAESTALTRDIRSEGSKRREVACQSHCTSQSSWCPNLQ